jgi:hypothetical protein
MLTIEATAALRALKTILLIGSCFLALSAAAPAGWILAGSRPVDYESAVDSQAIYNGRPSAYLRYVSTNEPKKGGFGTLMQTFSAKAYSSQRMRFSAYVRTDSVQDYAGLWMRVDKAVMGSLPTILAFDNMQDRPIKGTTGWRSYEVVLDVPEGSTSISLGILMGGKGTVWLNSVNVEIVSQSVPLTGRNVDGPVNLSFDK